VRFRALLERPIAPPRVSHLRRRDVLRVSEVASLVGVVATAFSTVGIGTASSGVLRRHVEATVATAKERYWLEQRLTRDGMLPVFQPVVSLEDDTVVGYEGLTRFAGGGATDHVFAAAARQGIGTAFQLEAARRILAVADQLPPEVWLSLNLSVTTLLDVDLGAVLGGASRPLRLEITEHEMVADYEAVAAAVDRLDDASLGVDDAGSGYASLRHVYELRPRMVKLDREWVAGIDADPVRRAMVRGLLTFTDSIGAVVVGEGVEREQERNTLADLGVPLAQGYLFGRPAPIGATEVSR
jgi:EAL domain-containing protein (putative c-di-GMP-specific phosphodiesterase class I)